MTEIDKKQLVISLIKDDLINSKLILGLNAAGLSAENYSLYLCQTIFKLMGYDEDNDRNERVYYGYVELTKKVADIDNTNGNDGFNPLAREIYNYLVRRKPGTKKK